MTTTLTTTKGRQRAIELDHEIEELLRDFIPLGVKLMQMRDSRLYLELPNPETGESFGTFEEYCRVKRGLAKSQVADTIRASMVVRAIEASSSGKAELPARMNHAMPLIESDLAEFDYVSRPELGSRVPVAVKNPDKVAKVWQGIAEKFDEEFKSAVKRKLEKKPRLTVTFITKNLPPQYRSKLPNPIVSKGKTDESTRAVKAADALRDILNNDFSDLDKLKELASKEGWQWEDLDSIRDAMKQVGDALDTARTVLGRLRI